jgi:hypothetical protein
VGCGRNAPAPGASLRPRRVGPSPLDDPARDVPGVDVARDRRESGAPRRSRLHRARAGHVPGALREREPPARAGAVVAFRRRRAHERRVDRPRHLSAGARARCHGERMGQPARDRRRRLVRASAHVPRRDPPRGRAHSLRRLPGDGVGARVARARARVVARRGRAANEARAPLSPAPDPGPAVGRVRRVGHRRAPLLALPRSALAAPRRERVRRRDPPRLPRARRRTGRDRRGPAAGCDTGRRVGPRKRRRERRGGPSEPAFARVRVARLHRGRAALGGGRAPGGARRRTARRPGAAPARHARRGGRARGVGAFRRDRLVRDGGVLGGARLRAERLDQPRRARARGDGRRARLRDDADARDRGARVVAASRRAAGRGARVAPRGRPPRRRGRARAGPAARADARRRLQPLVPPERDAGASDPPARGARARRREGRRHERRAPSRRRDRDGGARRARDRRPRRL